MNAPTRRAALTAAAALALGTPALAAGENPDAELIRLTEAYIAASQAFEKDGRDGDVNPHWPAMEAALEGLYDVPAAQTLAGVLAEARLACFIERGPEGSLRFGSEGGDWALQAAEDLMRLLGSTLPPLVARDTALRAPPPVPSPCPDAELVRRCHAYIDALDSFEQHGKAEDGCPYWAAVHDTRAAAEDLEPETFAGVYAMALVAQREARQLDGSENWSESFTGDWPRRIGEAVLHLVPGGRAA
jgi:hypothetical protein